MKTKSEVSQRVKVDVTLHYSVGSISFGISSIVISDGDRIADMNTEHIEKDGLNAARETKVNSRRWIIMTHISHVDEVHMTRPLGFIATMSSVELI